MTEIQKQAQSNKLSIAVAIIVAGIIIAGTMYLSGRGNSVDTGQNKSID